MTDTEDSATKKKLSLSSPGKLELKKTVEGGQVRQSFSHGRSKVVTVEVKKKRTFEAGNGGMKEVKEAPDPVFADVPEEAVEETPPAPPGDQGPTLTDHERAARAKALEDAKQAEEKRLIKAEEDKESESIRAKEAAEQEIRRKQEEKVRERQEADVRRRMEEEEALSREQRGQAAAEAGVAKLKAHDLETPAEEDQKSKRGKTVPKRPAPVRKGEPRRRAGKLTIADALDETERVRSLASVRRAREKQKKQEGPIEHGKIVREVILPETITVQELSNRMAERSVEVTKSLMKMGVMVTMHQTIDADTAELVAEEFGHKVKRVSDADVEIGMVGGDDDEGDLESRPPVVTVMGHVDHGKTSLLDALRQADVVSGEAGGITQHIGAYQVTSKGGHQITFIDTPGHAAFTAMRSRGAEVTDIVVLVVAADDGIMPQTVEAIDHAKAAEVPVIVAINKMDRPDADPTRIRTQLLEHEIVLEGMGGDVLDVEVSAVQKTNLDKLEEAISLQAEILDLKSNPARSAEGTIIESRVEPGRGPVATILVQRGTLNIGDIFVTGSEQGRVRAMMNDRGDRIQQAGPSVPVEVIGLNGAPDAGEDFVVVENETRAREISEFRADKKRTARTAIAPRGTLDEMFTAIQAGEAKELPVLIKADVQGSAEAISGLLQKLPQDEVRVNILHQAVGGINESDIQLAKASGSLVVGFNVRANKQARDLAEAEGVDIRYYSVIYDLADDIKGVLIGLMTPELRESFLGNAEIREVFNVSKIGKVAGCYVSEGTVKRGAKVRLLRDDVVIHEGSLSTLKRFKDDVREVQQNYECGMSFESYNDLKAGDIIECFDVEEIAPEL
ncbi:MAG: translation initiation factor IF-2 [Rhodospirillales bacterium]|nr:translation initiation factor IF-2 [Rhodospirillales bacterium]